MTLRMPREQLNLAICRRRFGDYAAVRLAATLRSEDDSPVEALEWLEKAGPLG